MNILPETSAAIQAIAGVISVILSITAIIISIAVERRINNRFSREQEFAYDIAKANIRPLLGVYTAEYIDLKAITLMNNGMGTAIITDIFFSKGGKKTKNIVELIHLSKSIKWDTFWDFSQNRNYFLQSGDHYTLAKLSSTNLLSQKYSEESTNDLLKEWQKEISGIVININYEDVLGNKQPSYRVTLL